MGTVNACSWRSCSRKKATLFSRVLPSAQSGHAPYATPRPAPPTAHNIKNPLKQTFSGQCLGILFAHACTQLAYLVGRTARKPFVASHGCNFKPITCSENHLPICASIYRSSSTCQVNGYDNETHNRRPPTDLATRFYFDAVLEFHDPS